MPGRLLPRLNLSQPYIPINDWNAIVDTVNGINSAVPGRGLVKNGYSLACTIGKDSASGIPAKITGAPTAGVYPVDLYADGISETSTGSATAAPLNLSIHETIPVDTWIIVTPKAYTEVESE